MLLIIVANHHHHPLYLPSPPYLCICVKDSLITGLSPTEHKDIDDSQQWHSKHHQRGHHSEEGSSSPIIIGILADHGPSIGVCEIGNRPYEVPDDSDEWKDVENPDFALFLHVGFVGDYEDVEGDGQPNQKKEDADCNPYSSQIDSMLRWEVPLCGVDDVVDEIPQSWDEDEDVIGPE